MKRRFPARHNDKNTHGQKPCHEHNIRHKLTLLNQTASTIHLPIGKAYLNNIDTLSNGYRNRFIGNILYRQLNTRQIIKSYIRNRFICFYRNTPLIANNTDFLSDDNVSRVEADTPHCESSQSVFYYYKTGNDFE